AQPVGFTAPRFRRGRLAACSGVDSPSRPTGSQHPPALWTGWAKGTGPHHRLCLLPWFPLYPDLVWPGKASAGGRRLALDGGRLPDNLPVDPLHRPQSPRQGEGLPGEGGGRLRLAGCPLGLVEAEGAAAAEGRPVSGRDQMEELLATRPPGP